MWPKDDYQEQVLAYLADAQTELERLARLRHPRRDLRELYADLDLASECLWQLIEASDRDWEGFRARLEGDCDALLRAFYRPSSARAFRRMRVTVTETLDRPVPSFGDAEPVSRLQISYPMPY